MITKNRVVRGLAGLVALGVVGGLSAGAVPRPAAADAQPNDHLTPAVLLDGHDLARAGWSGPEADDVDSDEGALLGRCAGPLPDLAPGFEELRGVGMNTSDTKINADGVELVMAFQTDEDARSFVQSYRTALEGRCLDEYGPQAWDVVRSAKVHLRSDQEHARTWTVKDSTNGLVTRSVSVVRGGERVALVWLSGYPKNPAKTLHLHRLVQSAADRIAA